MNSEKKEAMKDLFSFLSISFFVVSLVVSGFYFLGVYFFLFFVVVFPLYFFAGAYIVTFLAEKNWFFTMIGENETKAVVTRSDHLVKFIDSRTCKSGWRNTGAHWIGLPYIYETKELEIPGQRFNKEASDPDNWFTEGDSIITESLRNTFPRLYTIRDIELTKFLS